MLPGLRVILIVGKKSHFPRKRNYAYSAWDGEVAAIVFSPKIHFASKDTQDALIRHELSHALMQTLGIDHTERECDELAERVFGDKIYYDKDDVQTLDPDAPGARRPRPAYLPR